MKNLRLLTVMMMVSLFAVSCIVDDEVDNGFDSTARVVGFLEPFESVAYFEDLGVIQANESLFSKYKIESSFQ